MTCKIRFVISLGLTLALLGAILTCYANREDQSLTPSPLDPTFTSPLPSPLAPPIAPTATSLDSPLSVPPTAQSPISPATLEAIRATRPTATPPTPSGMRLPYISPATWRDWALRLLIAAAVLAYIGLRLRRGQKT